MVIPFQVHKTNLFYLTFSTQIFLYQGNPLELTFITTFKLRGMETFNLLCQKLIYISFFLKNLVLSTKNFID